MDSSIPSSFSFFFFFNDTATTEIYTSVHTLSLHDPLPISAQAHGGGACPPGRVRDRPAPRDARLAGAAAVLRTARGRPGGDRADRERRAEGVLRSGLVPQERGRHLPAGRADRVNTRMAPVNIE